MSNVTFCGIQQIGVGIPNVYEAWKWYRENFGMDIRVFDEAAEAGLMLPYTGGVPRKRHAVLAVNLQGGGGFEIWQYTERTPQPPEFEPQLGDYGIFIGKIKSKNVAETFDLFTQRRLNVLGKPTKDLNGKQHFYVKDPYGNIFEILEDDYWFKDEGKLTGGPFGAVVGVSDIDNARKVYSDILGYDVVSADKEDVFEDFMPLPGGDKKFRRVVLSRSVPMKGSFSRLFGPSTIELIQVIDRKARKIFENRLWGDLGFIHLCFDMRNMNALKELCEAKGFPFTVDSANSFDMGEAAGHFTYIEDPDGTLIEFVETHKVPLMKKLGWYMNLKNRPAEKNMPDWMIKAMRFNRYKGK